MPDGLPELDKECFVISPIGAEGSAERARSDGVLKFIIAKAAEELGLTAVRGDQLADPGQITLQVIDHILGARAAVADLTGLNPNVFYELAVRHTARLPIALIAEKDCKLPFDIAQMRTIFFDSHDLASADQCRSAIAAQLRQAITGGAVDSPIATSIDVRALASGSTADRNIAEIVTTIDDIAKTQRSIAAMVQRLDPRTPETDFLNQEFMELVNHIEAASGRLEMAIYAIDSATAGREPPDITELAATLTDLRALMVRVRQLESIASRRLPAPPA
jgi:hypothetical protein